MTRSDNAAAAQVPARQVSQAHSEVPTPFEYRDLKAQESMAFWAMLMFLAAVVTLLITALGTLLIWRQVTLTRKAVEETGDATRAMVRSNEIAERAQRPWLSMSRYDVGHAHQAIDGPVVRLDFAIWFENNGIIPATEINAFLDFKVAGNEKAPEFSYVPSPEPFFSTAGPGVAFSLATFSRTTEEITAMAAQGHALWVYAYITYKSAVDPEKVFTSEMTLCLTVEGSRLVEGRSQFMFGAQPRGPQNRMT